MAGNFEMDSCKNTQFLMLTGGETA